jgi:hypothetical protein
MVGERHLLVASPEVPWNFYGLSYFITGDMAGMVYPEIKTLFPAQPVCLLLDQRQCYLDVRRVLWLEP